jgi:hypothetical protein
MNPSQVVVECRMWKRDTVKDLILDLNFFGCVAIFILVDLADRWVIRDLCL